MKIRQANNKDIKQLVPILLQITNLHYENRPEIFKKKQEKQIEENIKDILKSEEEKVIVGEIQGKISCVLVYKIKETKNHINLNNSKVLWINEIGVDDKYKRKGMGETLMKEAMKIAKDMKCQRLELNCWNFNEDALKFYEKQNMKVQRKIMEIEI